MMHIETFVFNFFAQNTYLLYDDTKEAVLIDCGCMTGQEKQRLTDFVGNKNLDLKAVLMTHMHLDHAFGLAYMLDAYGLKPRMHRFEHECLPSLNEQAKRFVLPTRIEDVEPGDYIEPGEDLHFGDTTLKVLFVPGHSPGGLSFYNEESQAVFAGDALFQGSIGRTDLWGGDMHQLTDAIKEQILSLPDETVVYSGHGPTTTVRDEKKHNPYL